MQDILKVTMVIKSQLKIFYRKILYFLVNFGLIKKNQIPISFISEKKHWAVYWEGVGISNEINKINGNDICTQFFFQSILIWIGKTNI
jgi:hypothetical protein